MTFWKKKVVLLNGEVNEFFFWMLFFRISKERFKNFQFERKILEGKNEFLKNVIRPNNLIPINQLKWWTHWHLIPRFQHCHLPISNLWATNIPGYISSKHFLIFSFSFLTQICKWLKWLRPGWSALCPWLTLIFIRSTILHFNVTNGNYSNGKSWLKSLLPWTYIIWRQTSDLWMTRKFQKVSKWFFVIWFLSFYYWKSICC